MIEPDQFAEKLAGGGSGPTICSAAFSAITTAWLRTTEDAVDLPKMVQVVGRLHADKFLDRLPSAHLVDSVTLHPPCARNRLQQSQIAFTQRPKDPCRKSRILLDITQALRPNGFIPPG